MQVATVQKQNNCSKFHIFLVRPIMRPGITNLAKTSKPIIPSPYSPWEDMLADQFTSNGTIRALYKTTHNQPKLRILQVLCADGNRRINVSTQKKECCG